MFIRNERSVKEFISYYPVVSILVSINFALWIITLINHPNSIYLWGVGQNYAMYEFGQYWRMVTPIFLHGSLTHVLFNSFALVLFGPALEQMLGRFKFIIAYLLAGIAGNIGTFIVEPTAVYTHLGASGAVYGLFGMYLYMVVLRKQLIDSGNAQIVTTIFFIGLVMTFINPGINIYAHIFGFIGGFAIGPLLLRNAQPFSMYRNQRRRPRNDGSAQFDPNRWQKKRISGKFKMSIFWALLIILVIFGFLGKLF